MTLLWRYKLKFILWFDNVWRYHDVMNSKNEISILIWKTAIQVENWSINPEMAFILWFNNFWWRQYDSISLKIEVPFLDLKIAILTSKVVSVSLKVRWQGDDDLRWNHSQLVPIEFKWFNLREMYYRNEFNLYIRLKVICFEKKLVSDFL